MDIVVGAFRQPPDVSALNVVFWTDYRDHREEQPIFAGVLGAARWPIESDPPPAIDNAGSELLA